MEELWRVVRRGTLVMRRVKRGNRVSMMVGKAAGGLVVLEGVW